MSHSDGSTLLRNGRNARLLWYIGIGVVVLLLIGAFIELRRPGAASYSSFLDQLDAGNVASVTFQGTQIQAHLKQPLPNTANPNAAPQATLITSVPEIGDSSLISELRKQHVEIDVAAASWTSALSRIPWPIWLFAGALLLAGLRRLTRRGTATAGPSAAETAMSMHPMGGMMRLASGLFGEPKQDTTAVSDDAAKTKS